MRHNSSYFSRDCIAQNLTGSYVGLLHAGRWWPAQVQGGSPQAIELLRIGRSGVLGSHTLPQESEQLDLLHPILGFRNGIGNVVKRFFYDEGHRTYKRGVCSRLLVTEYTPEGVASSTRNANGADLVDLFNRPPKAFKTLEEAQQQEDLVAVSYYMASNRSVLIGVNGAALRQRGDV